jgi:hypothetical protein
VIHSIVILSVRYALISHLILMPLMMIMLSHLILIQPNSEPPQPQKRIKLKLSHWMKPKLTIVPLEPMMISPEPV